MILGLGELPEETAKIKVRLLDNGPASQSVEAKG